MLNDNIQTKICKTCGRELPLEEFPNFFGRVSRNCKCCSLEKRIEKRKQHTLEKYEKDDTLKIKRVYKHIKKFQILTKKVSGIAHLSQFEKFVRLLDYKHTWVSNYGRIIIQNDDGTYELLKGKYSRDTGELTYTLKKNTYFPSKKYYGYRNEKVTASSLVIKAFIVNYDVKNNTRCWHENNDKKDNFYKHLYPVTDKQYSAIEALYNKQGSVSEAEIMEIVNAVQYKPIDWDPWYLRRVYENVACLGDRVDADSDAFIRWRNMIQRCYNSKVHSYKPYYRGKKVCEEWLIFSNFKVWYDEYMTPRVKVDLDKDLICKSSNIYSPETCVFISHFLNTLFEDRGTEKKIEQTEDGKYKVYMYILNKKVEGDIHDTESEALRGFYDLKKKYIEKVAENSKGSVPDYVYEAMLNWKVVEDGSTE